jgi:CRISPR-associated protein Cas6/Cse3/CasE subtype I-E
MYEVRIGLNKRNAGVRNVLKYPHVLHKMLEWINPQRQRFLWRLMPEHGLIVRSVEPLEWETFNQRYPNFGEQQHNAFEPTLLAGKQYLFNVLAYARRAALEGQRMMPLQPEDYLEWFNRKGATAGYISLECDAVRQLKYHVKTRSLALNLLPVELMGRLQVEDPELFQRMLSDGLGRMKAYGCGLMLLRSAASPE